MESFYCRLRDEKTGEPKMGFIGKAVDSHAFTFPDKNTPSGFSSRVLIGVIWFKEDKENEELLPTNRPSPDYLPPERLQALHESFEDNFEIDEDFIESSPEDNLSSESTSTQPIPSSSPQENSRAN